MGWNESLPTVHWLLSWQNDNEADDASLAVNVWGLDFPNPVGLAAGFDKHAEVFMQRKEDDKKLVGAKLRSNDGFLCLLALSLSSS